MVKNRIRTRITLGEMRIHAPSLARTGQCAYWSMLCCRARTMQHASVFAQGITGAFCRQTHLTMMRTYAVN